MKAAHLKGGKGQSRGHPNKVDGKKSDNDCFMYNMAILVGCQCEITIRDGRKFDGVFSAFSSDRHELMIESAYLVTEDMNEDTPIQESFEVLVVPADKMLSVRFKSVDTTYATRDFATDSAISGNRNAGSKDKQLTPWDGPDVASDEDLSLDTDLTGKENGWEAKDMFKKNEEKYGVVSSYSHDLSGYTTQIDKTDSETLKRHEQAAAQVANEIEKNVVSWEHSELENGEDEEEAFSAVVRPRNSSHSNINNNNNNSGNSGSSNSDKYIPPSRRMGSAQPSAQPMSQQGIPMNNNGATQMNNNASNNPRNKIYSQNQTPRGGYGVPPNNSYHDRRNNYDNRRGPPPNQQYPPPSGHNDGRRMDDGNRPQRVPNKVNERRGGRDDPAKLKEFSANFRLQSSDPNQQPRRMPMNQPHPSAQPVSANNPPADLSAQNTRTTSPPSSSNKSQKEESVPQATSLQQASVEVTEKVVLNSGASGVATPNSVSNSGSNISVNIPSNDGTPVNGGNMGDMSTPGSCDSKNSEKKFTFNPNAKEFNPCAKSFTSRSPSTPPRPPSTPAQASTPQMMQTQPIHQFMPISMPILYGQPYPQTAALTPSSSSSGSSGGATPRHGGGGGHRKGVGMMGGPPRSDMTPPIQMTAGPPLLVPASLQAGGGPHQYAYVPQPNFSQVMRLPPTMPVYQNEGGGSAQMHQQVHFMQHNGAPTQNSGHPNSNTPSNTPNPQNQTPVVSANGQGYNQGGANQGGASHVGFPYGVVPVMNMNMGYHPHGPPHMNMILPYVSSHQGTTVIPQSQ